MIRKFTIPLTGSVADPSHIIKMVELGEEPVQYASYEPLKKLIYELELKSAKDEGYNEAMVEILKNLGMTYPEYYNKCESNKT